MMNRLLIFTGAMLGIIVSIITKNDMGLFFFGGWLIGFLSWLLTLPKQKLQKGRIVETNKTIKNDL